ncbi:hypothetical protein C0J52_07890 [Blattella germanica]|nr:hypothetical protein C0J52_07890 [Blattella germanica]
MSGTALADWALTTSNIFTIQVAQALNCPLKETNNEMAECLRKRRIDEIMAVKVEAPEFKTRFGPMVDGSVVPNDPVHLTGEYHDLFGRYELLYGVTELESYNLLDAVSLRYGMLEQDRDKKIRAYVQERFQYLPDMYLAETLKAYTDVSRRISDSSSQSIAENNRDTLLDILSDARVVAPMVQTANFHSSANPKSYFYVFSHRNMYGDFATVTIDKSIHGEELPYVFGVPIVKGDFPGNPYSALHEEFPSHSVFTDAERLLSEAVITFWTNFAKTGIVPRFGWRNPNAPVRPRFGTLFETDWPEYDSVNQMFLGLGIPPVIGQRYRSQMTTFWNTYLREAEKTSEYQGDDSCPGANTTGQDAEPGTTSTVAISIVVVIGLCLLLINLCACAGLYYQRDRLRAQERLMKRLYGHVPPPANNADLYIKHKGNGRVGTKNVVVVEMAEKKDNNKKKAVDQTVEQVYEAVRNAGRVENGEEEDEEDRELNLKRWELSRQCSHSTIDTHTKVTQWIASEMIQRYSPKLKRANFQQQTSYPTFHNNSMDTNLTSTFESPTERAEKKLPQRNLVKPAIAPKPQFKKVSVAIDATPKLIPRLIPKQVPLENVSKSMENLGKCVSTTRITFQQKRPPLKRAETFRESLTKSSSSPERGKRLSKSVTSINLQVDPENSAEKGNGLPIVHKHSTSDPVSKSAKEAVRSNMNNLKPRFVDISLDTSEFPKKGRIEKSKTLPVPILDSKNKNSKPVGMSSPQASRPKLNKISSADIAENKGKDTNQLADIKRKNYPKVLPNIPPEIREKQAKEFQKEWELVRNIASQKDDPQTHIYGRPRQQVPTTPGRSRKQYAAPNEPEATAIDESKMYPKLASQTSKKRDDKAPIPVVRKHQEEQPPPTTQRPVLKRQPPVQCQQCAMLQMSPASPKPQKPQRIHRSDASTETKNTTLQEFKPQSKESKQTSTTSMVKSELSASKTGTVKRGKQKIDAAFQTEESAPDEEIPVVSPFKAHDGCVVCETLYGHLGKD